MDEQLNVIKWVSAATVSMVGYLFGEWTLTLKALLILVAVDWLTGWAAAWLNGELRSMKGFIGIAKKICIFLFVTVAHVIDMVLGDMHYLRDTVVLFYLANEMLSVAENAGRMGIPMPPVLRNAIELLNRKSETEQGGKRDADTGSSDK